MWGEEEENIFRRTALMRLSFRQLQIVNVSLVLQVTLMQQQQYLKEAKK